MWRHRRTTEVGKVRSGKEVCFSMGSRCGCDTCMLHVACISVPMCNVPCIHQVGGRAVFSWALQQASMEATEGWSRIALLLALAPNPPPTHSHQHGRQQQSAQLQQLGGQLGGGGCGDRRNGNGARQQCPSLPHHHPLCMRWAA